MNKSSVATLVAGIMFVMGVALAGASKMESSELSTARLKPSVDMLKSN